MTFSVIIPTYNRASILTDTINSVLHQSFADFEVIVVDDGSTDNTRHVVETISDNRVRYYHKKNEERSIARNYGAAQAKGRFLVFLDSDDRMTNHHLSGLNDYLFRHEFRPRFLFSGFVVKDTNGNTAYEFKKTGKFPPKKLLYGNYLGCSAVAVERTLFDNYRFNTHPDLVVFEDWELWLRIISHEPLHCIAGATIIMTNHGGRSVLNFSVAEFEKKAECLFTIAIKDIPLVRASSFSLRRLTMGVYSYGALHVALSKENRGAALRFLGRAIFQDPTLVFKRRFYAIIKHLF